MTRLCLSNYIIKWGGLDNEVKGGFQGKKDFVKQNLNIDISDTYKDEGFFRIDQDTCKIFCPYSRIIFEFDEHNYMEENSNIHCIIEYNHYALFDVDDLDTIDCKLHPNKHLTINEGYAKNHNNILSFINQFDLIQNYVKTESINMKDYPSTKVNFDFKFTTNDSDIDIFLPYVDIFKEFIFGGCYSDPKYGNKQYTTSFFKENYFTKSIKQVIEKNLIKKEKMSKRNVNLDDVMEDLSALKKTIQPIMYEFLIYYNPIADPLRRWVVGLSRTLTNVIVEHDFSKIIVNYTPYQQPKSNMVHKKTKANAKSNSNMIMMTK